MKLLKLTLLTLVFSLLNACSDDNDSRPLETTKIQLEPQFVNTDEMPKVLMQTSMGDIEIALDDKKAPLSVKNFLAYTEKGFYNGTIFHRVISDFMIQGGGYTTDHQKKDNMPQIQNEANNGLRNEDYTVAMARTGYPHSATSQFFINTKNNRFLNHSSESSQGWGYAVFGIVTKGRDVVDKIEAVETGRTAPFPSDVPKTQVIIKSVALLK